MSAQLSDATTAIPNSEPVNPCKKYRKYHDFQYKILIDSAKDGYDLETCMSRSGIDTVGAARRILRKHQQDSSYVSPKKRGGMMHQKYSKDDITRKMIQRLQLDPTLTLQKLRADLQMESPPCIQTLSNYLHNKTITYKKAQQYPYARNSAAVKQDRQQYAAWRESLSQSSIGSYPDLIFVDEMGVDLMTRRVRGRSLLGTSVHVAVPSQRGVHMSVLSAVSLSLGCFYCEVETGKVDSDRFALFIFNVRQKWSDLARKDGTIKAGVIVMDNASIHSTVKIAEMLSGSALTHHFLPAWSPMLNPIEFVNHSHKTKIRDIMSEKQDELRMIDEDGQGDKGVRRRRILEETVLEGWERLKTMKVAPIYSHCDGFLGRCARGEEIYGDGPDMAFPDV